MALLSSAHFEKEDLLEALSLVRAESPEQLNPLEGDNDNFETSLTSSLTYTLGYDRGNDDSVVGSHVQVASVTEYAEQSLEQQEDDNQLSSEYVSVGSFPFETRFEKFSLLRCCHKDRRAYYKNLYALSIVFFLVIGAHEGLVGIETTINSDQGLATLAVENVFLVLSVLIAPGVIWLLGIRGTMLLACVLQVGYITSNYLRSYYTLIPGAIIGGFSLGLLWVAANLYNSVTASTLASVVGAKPTVVIGKFGGVFYFFVSLSLMIGNLVSSALFTLKDEVNCGHNGATAIFDTALNMSIFPTCSCDIETGIRELTRYVLVSIFAFGVLLAIILLVITVENVPRLVTNAGTLRGRIIHYFKSSIISILRIHFNTKAGLLIPVFMLEGLQAGYYLGTFTTDFIAQCVGVRYVGFGVAVWAFGSAIGSFIAGRTVKYVKRYTLFTATIGLSLFLCLFLIFFKRVESFPLIFLISFGFGLSDGILKTGVSCLVTGRFHKLKTSVYSILRMWIGVGLIIHFSLSLAVKHYVLLWIIVGAAGIGLPLYGVVDRDSRLLLFSF